MGNNQFGGSSSSDEGQRAALIDREHRSPTIATFHSSMVREEPQPGPSSGATSSSSSSVARPRGSCRPGMVLRGVDIEVVGVLGEGMFGRTIQGVLRNRGGTVATMVAVKIWNVPVAGLQGSEKLLSLRKENHLCPILGIINDDSNPSLTGPTGCTRIITEFFPEGNLLNYLSNYPQDNATLAKFCVEIASACEYLHSRDIIHGNLAGRNILIQKSSNRAGPFFTAIVSDYGISQDAMDAVSGSLKPSNMQNQRWNYEFLRWLPKEVMIQLPVRPVFTRESDVWSFGVVLWEIYSGGGTPFAGLAHTAVYDCVVLKGKSPLSLCRPLECPEPILEIMERTFRDDPEERPTFERLKKVLRTLRPVLSRDRVPVTTNDPPKKKRSSMVLRVGSFSLRRNPKPPATKEKVCLVWKEKPRQSSLPATGDQTKKPALEGYKVPRRIGGDVGRVEECPLPSRVNQLSAPEHNYSPSAPPQYLVDQLPPNIRAGYDDDDDDASAASAPNELQELEHTPSAPPAARAPTPHRNCRKRKGQLDEIAEILAAQHISPRRTSREDAIVYPMVGRGGATPSSHNPFQFVPLQAPPPARSSGVAQNLNRISMEGSGDSREVRSRSHRHSSRERRGRTRSRRRRSRDEDDQRSPARRSHSNLKHNSKGGKKKPASSHDPRPPL